MKSTQKLKLRKNLPIDKSYRIKTTEGVASSNAEAAGLILPNYGSNTSSYVEEIEKGGFILAHWDGTTETEEKIKEDTKATIRCIPFDGDKTPGKCMVTGKPSACRVIFARSY